MHACLRQTTYHEVVSGAFLARLARCCTGFARRTVGLSRCLPTLTLKQFGDVGCRGGIEAKETHRV
jgi:hypothetical protein